ncbi:hypothetical protein AB0J72_42970 [Dactylosporangium sp. NPDC049742]|uniref:hypothetical protein n=1 Tax=Dactylosporangium sp. NPDC049742 TaxID=3154737 RepID=UPI00341A7FB2
MPAHVYKVTKRDPMTHWYDDYERSDCGDVESAYLAAVAAFGRETGIARLAIREPQVAGWINFGLDPPVEGDGLTGLFPPDLAGFHDGAQIDLPVGLELVRVMLRESGAWCRLELDDRFLVHVGYDQYMYVGSEVPCPVAVAEARELGLFVEPISDSPWAYEFEDTDERRPADDAFWTEVGERAEAHGSLLLEATAVINRPAFHRLTPGDLAAVRDRLAPRTMLAVWPDLSPDVDAVLGDLPDGLFTIVWQDEQGRIMQQACDDRLHDELRAIVSGARAAMVIHTDGIAMLARAIAPDADGVVRARWAFHAED